VALAGGVTVDVEALSERLGVPVVPTCGRTGSGRDALVEQILAGGRPGRRFDLRYPAEVEDAAADLREQYPDVFIDDEPVSGVRSALSSAGAAQVLSARLDTDGHCDAADALARARERLERGGIDVATTAAAARYNALGALVDAVATTSGDGAVWQRRLDRVLTHPVTGTLVLLAVFALLFEVVFSWSGPAIDFVDGSVSAFGAWLGAAAGGGLFGDFLAKGVVAGLGAFLVFVPQIAMLFICIEALEASGYLARAAFLLDRIMGKAGLPGRSFLPLLSGFACAIPGIMATRTIEDRRDRFVTMAVLPLMSCSARLPVYAVVVGALFARSGRWVPSLIVLSMYLLGIGAALLGAKLLRHTVLVGGRSPLLLELPPYRRPSTRVVVRNTARRTWTFVAGAGPIILGFSMVLWGLLTFPQDVQYSAEYQEQAAALELVGQSRPLDADLDERLADLEARREAERLAHTYMGRTAKLIEPAIEPLGFDWKIGIAVLGSFAAREVFVPTLGVTYAVGDAHESHPGLLQSMRDDVRPDGTKVFTPLVGISLLVFYVLAMQCMSTLAIIKRETKSWRWPIWIFVILTAVAYLASLIVFQVGTALGY